MAYNPKNKLKAFRRILQIYSEVKQEDIPDTFIVQKVFPKHHIYISYRTWMTIKGMKPSELQYEGDKDFVDPNQLSLF
ncbi:hypothetical protein [Brumimicrobium mesophilum]|uniref:hypothetical protein n=1 Tax=Brumimicrobium mesophilum TaxID=392717 RepID=UPI000D141FEE|nr:hypothetical protein [Brumimicrobium mesophilum]